MQQNLPKELENRVAVVTGGASGRAPFTSSLDHAEDGIRVNAVCPGEIDTPMLRSARDTAPTEEDIQRITESVPMKRLGQPVEVAQVVVFLASDSASYITGSLVDVDAGYSIP